jgi:hypothetical protein
MRLVWKEMNCDPKENSNKRKGDQNESINKDI